MTFDLADLAPLAASLARAGLPVLAKILGTVVPFPFSLAVGPAFAAIAGVLGVDPAAPDAPAQIATKVDAAPADAAAKLQAVEAAHADIAKAAEDELAARLKDVEDARAVSVQLSAAHSPLAWGAPVVSGLAVGGFFVICGIMLFHVGDQTIAQGILGAMTVGWTTVLTYWCGSSKGSADKTDALTSIARSNAAPAPAPVRRR